MSKGITNMDNNLTVANKEKTFIISISWQSKMDKEDKEKVHSIVSQALELWEGKELISKAIHEQN